VQILVALPSTGLCSSLLYDGVEFENFLVQILAIGERHPSRLVGTLAMKADALHRSARCGERCAGSTGFRELTMQ